MSKHAQSQVTPRWRQTFQSRRVRTVGVVLGLSCLAALIAWNWNSAGPHSSDDEFAELDLADLPAGSDVDGRQFEHTSEPRFFGQAADVTTSAMTIGHAQSDSEGSGPAIHVADQPASGWSGVGIQTVSGVSQPAVRRLQGAWLTGQIEVEANRLPTRSLSFPSAGADNLRKVDSAVR
jgi:hypothetical protein